VSDTRQSVAIEFLGLLLADRADGRARSLAEYLALFPHHQETVAAEYLRAHSPDPVSIASALAESDAHRIGPYRLLAELGHGGQGVVWLADDERLSRRVALKVVPHTTASSGLSPRFRREATVAARVVHPGLCAVFDVGSDSRCAWIAMQFVEGRTLARHVQDAVASGASGLDAGRSIVWIEKAARALHAAHEAQIVHRDIKPANLMITREGDVVVLDFGVAKELADAPSLTLTGDALGTPAYMSPEQIRGESVDRRTDVWSLGVSLYEALTLRRPFEAPTRERLLQDILGTDPLDVRRLEPDLGRDVAIVIATALAKEPERRYQTALDLAEDLRRVREHEPILARPATALDRFRRWTKRNPALATSFGALLVVLIGALAITSTLLTRTRRTLGEVEQLSDHKLARDLLEAEHSLWPALPATIERLGDWLRRAEEVAHRRPTHVRAREATAQRSLELGTALADRDAWLLEQLDELLALLDRLDDTRARVGERLDFARTVERRSLVDVADAWRAASARVNADPRFAGFVLAPQIGLIPLGPDPKSGFEEFAHLASGRPPERDAATDGLQLDETTSVVLVLVPATRTLVGAAPPDAQHQAGAPFVDALADEYEGPTVEVELDAFLLSKYEMTQAQWLRHTRENPSAYGVQSRFAPATDPLTMPVEQMPWLDATRVMAELDLALPTEAQWEYATRAGTTTPWFTGELPSSLQGYANVADRFARENAGHPGWEFDDDLDDGATVHGPVGSLRANPFGFHDVIGNVSEWCRDPWEARKQCPPRPGDGLLECDEGSRVFRGGAFSLGPHESRCSARNGLPDHVGAFNVGLRPARALR
jgi:serine/threonine protein kinase/formylglycine-generating enzyme required for sulfatase activity